MIYILDDNISWFIRCTCKDASHALIRQVQYFGLCLYICIRDIRGLRTEWNACDTYFFHLVDNTLAYMSSKPYVEYWRVCVYLIASLFGMISIQVYESPYTMGLTGLGYTQNVVSCSFLVTSHRTIDPVNYIDPLVTSRHTHNTWCTKP